MTAITDLSWQQLAAVLGGNSKVFLGEDPDGNIGVLISVSSVNGEAAASTNATGVVKCLMRHLAAASSAQSLANEVEGVTEKLAAFPAATTEGAIVNGYVVQKGEIKAAIGVASATQVVGPTQLVSTPDV